MDARVIAPDAAHTLRLYDVAFQWGIGAEETDGRISLLEVSIPPRTLVKPHAHTREDEFSYVLAGPIGVRVGDSTTETVPTGSWLIKPRGVPHAIWNVGEEPARILEVVTPGGLERYFQTIAPILMEHGPEWTKRYDDAAEEFGLEILNDWSNELQATYGITL
jgi:quercetin dioxygenase-like cupin family protein